MKQHLNIFHLLILVTLTCCFSCQNNVHEFPLGVLEFKDPDHSKILTDPKFECQIRYTQIEKSNEDISFKSYQFNVDTTLYFYPASTVKMPVAFLALEKLNHIKDSLKISRNKILDLVIDSVRPPQTFEYSDSTTNSLKPNIYQYIKKIFAVSDNNAYNRLYEFLGTDYINKTLKKKGIFSNSRIVHRVGVGGYSADDQLYCNPYKLMDNDTIIYFEKERKAVNTEFDKLKRTQKGKAYQKNGQLIKTPFDFSTKNFINIIDLEKSLMRIIYPEIFSEEERFKLTDQDYTFLKEVMSKPPRQFTSLKYDSSYYDSYVKFFIYGDSKAPMPEQIKIHNKVGYAYGYLIDVAYIEDKSNDIAFFLTATIHVNANETYNDDNYEYETLGIPFLAQLGRQVYNFELQRKLSK